MIVLYDKYIPIYSHNFGSAIFGAPHILSNNTRIYLCGNTGALFMARKCVDGVVIPPLYCAYIVRLEL